MLELSDGERISAIDRQTDRDRQLLAANTALTNSIARIKINWRYYLFTRNVMQSRECIAQLLSTSTKTLRKQICIW